MNEIVQTKDNKALIVATVASTIDQFCMEDMYLLNKSYSVQVAANFSKGNNTSKERVKEFMNELTEKNNTFNEINFNRNPFSFENIKAYHKIKKLIKSNSFSLIHCHTPIAAMLLRIAAKKTLLNRTKIIYTAHGFHFFKGAPIKNWMLFYPIEKWLSRYTDVIITINKEDYKRASKLFKACKVEYIPGVGVDTKKLSELNIEKSVKRKELGIEDNAFLLLSVGELNRNKNHKTVIKAIAKLNNPNLYYIICGQGVLEGYLSSLIKSLGLEKQIKILGYRWDINEIYKASDVFVLPSFREGLSVSLMEAMSVELPIVCSNIRGNTDLIVEGSGGFLSKPDDYSSFADSINKLYLDRNICKKMGIFNVKYIKNFDINIVNKKMEKIYFSQEQINQDNK